MQNAKNGENYLDRIPTRNPLHGYSADEEGLITLEIENKGIFNRIAQKLFKKPRISYVHLDAFGSFVWERIDGARDITAIGILVDEHFGEEAHPLYERLAKFFMVLESYGFIRYEKK